MRKRDIASKIVYGWDTLSSAYQEHNTISTYDVHYGPLAYGEKKLKILGAVKGKRALEIGCGGGQNTIALARWGAKAFGIDPSSKQIEYARLLAKKCGVRATFEVAPAEDLTLFDNEYFDLALSSFAFGYVSDLHAAYGEAHRVLKGGGVLVLCDGHPLFHIFNSFLEGSRKDESIPDYLSWPEVAEWDWEYEGRPPVRMHGYDRTLPQLINPLLRKGFALERIIEQGVRKCEGMSKGELAWIPYLCKWNEKEFGIGRKIPYTLILKARKKAARAKTSRKRKGRRDLR